MSESLFALPSDAYKVTSDDCYTPRWVFDAMGLQFDLDVAAPKGGPWHVPCDRYYTAEDDGLAQPWDGLVWCNPPWSQFGRWADRYEAHDQVVIMGLCLSETLWFPQVLNASDAVAFCYVEFHRAEPGPTPNRSDRGADDTHPTPSAPSTHANHATPTSAPASKP